MAYKYSVKLLFIFVFNLVQIKHVLTLFFLLTQMIKFLTTDFIIGKNLC